MAGENDNNDEGNNPSGSNSGNDDAPKGGQFRKKYEDALDKIKQLEGRLLIHDAGLGHLSAKQRKAVINDASESEGELTADLLKASAKELGYATEAPAKGKEDQGNEGGEGENNGQGQGQGENQGQGDDDDLAGATGSDLIDRIMGRQTKATQPGSFEQRLKDAKTQEEAEALIRNEGAAHGLVHEWDVE